jgi:hypothetical protein
VLRGRAAAWHLRLIKGKPPAPEVMAPREKDIDGLMTIRSRYVDARDLMTWRAIPVTTPARDAGRPRGGE